jgi:hypothetical protein
VADVYSTSAFVVSPELSTWVEVLTGDRFEIKDAKLAVLRPEHDASALSAPSGDDVGAKPPSRWPQCVMPGQGPRLGSSEC